MTFDLQHPRQTAVQLGVHTLQIGQRHLLLEDHLVERSDEVGIQEATMEDTQSQASPNKLEIVQMLRVDA